MATSQIMQRYVDVEVRRRYLGVDIVKYNVDVGVGLGVSDWSGIFNMPYCLELTSPYERC